MSLINSQNWLRIWKVFPRKPLPVSTDFTTLKRRVNYFPLVSMLTIPWLSQNLITTTDADILYPMVWIELVIFWFPVRKFWCSGTEMSEKVVPPPWEVKMLLSMWLRLTPFAHYKPVWKVTELSESKMWLIKSIFSSPPPEIKTLLWPILCRRWKITRLSAISDILTMRLTWLA